MKELTESFFLLKIICAHYAVTNNVFDVENVYSFLAVKKIQSSVRFWQGDQ